MRLSVRDERHQFNQQTHAYAEYRAFSSLVHADFPVDDVTVTLTRGPGNDEADHEGRIACTIAVRMASGDVVEARAVARHAYAAIDRAVSLIRRRSPATAVPVRARREPVGHDSVEEISS